LITYQPAKAAWIKNQAAVGCLIFCGNTSNRIAGRKTADFRGWCCTKRIAFLQLSRRSHTHDASIIGAQQASVAGTPMACSNQKL